MTLEGRCSVHPQKYETGKRPWPPSRSANMQSPRSSNLEAPPLRRRGSFADLTAEMLEICQRELPQGQLTPDGWVNMSYHTFLVKTDRYTMLVYT